jgi:hypothetical protein
VESGHVSYLWPGNDEVIVRDIPTSSHDNSSHPSAAIISHFRGPYSALDLQFSPTQRITYLFPIIGKPSIRSGE